MTPHDREQFDAYIASQKARPLRKRIRDALSQWASGHDLFDVSFTVVIGLALLVIALMGLAHCGPAVHPKTGPGTDWPCGTRGVACGNGNCCWLGDVCGSDQPFSTCRAGMCCNEMVDELGESRRMPYTQIDWPDMVDGRVAR